MLTKQQGLASLDFERGLIVPDRLTRGSHHQYLQYAERMLDWYRSGIGRTRQELHRGVAEILAMEEDCPVRRIAAFAKLLDDVSEYQRDRAGKAAALRREVFHRAARRHPLVREPDRLFENSEASVKAEIAASLGKSWETIDAELFADVIEFHRLEKFEGYADGAALLSRYNVAQVQVALYGAQSVTIVATADFKTILKYAKLARLLHTVQRTQESEWLIRLDGPASILRETQRYGVNLAKFLPALITCRGWKMQAIVPVGRSGWKLKLQLSVADGLKSHLPTPEEFDSEVESRFAASWGAEPRNGWRLMRESEILFEDQHVFFPDFTFEHDDGRRKHLEIVGFWTPEYIEAKSVTLSRFARHEVAVAIVASQLENLPKLPGERLIYKTRLKVADVEAWLAK
jgi:predicted nuclease of restriction endonuclease-like RecB superfamily